MVLKKILKATPIGAIVNSVFKAVGKLLEWLIDVPNAPARQGLTVQREGSDNHLPVVYGTRKVGAVLVHKIVTDQSGGADNEFLHYIAAFCHGEVDAIEEIFFNGISENDPQRDGWLQIQRATGAADQAALTEAVNQIPNWGNLNRGRGVCYAYIRLRQDKDQSVWRGEPQITARIRGQRVYDWRTDTTAYSENPAVCAVDFLRSSIYGRGLSDAEINYPQFTQAAEFCDEITQSEITETTCSMVDQSPPGSGEFDPQMVCTTNTTQELQVRYRLAALIDTNNTVLENYRELLAAFRAFPRRTNGVVGVKVETVGEPLMTFDEDTIKEGSVSFDFVGARGRYNQVVVRFPNEKNEYERDEFVYPESGSALRAEWLEEDANRPLVGEFEFETFASKSCAAQMAEIIAKRSRVGGVVTFQAIDFAGVRRIEPGDIFGVTLESFGWNNKPFRLKAIRENRNGAFDIQAVEHENVVYPWSGGEWSEQIGGTDLGNPAVVQPPTNLSITTDPTFATSGTLRWEGVNDSFVRRYDIVISGDGVDIYDEEVRAGARSWSIPLLDAGSYSATIKSISTIGRTSEPATILFDLVVPVAPSDLGLTSSNNTITSEPFLAGLGLGTVFEFDIDDLSDPNFSPEGRFRGRSVTFSGRLPDREYRVWVRTVNALGISGWVSDTIFTTLNIAEVPFLDGLEEDLIELNADLRGIDDIMEQVAQDISEIGDRRSVADRLREEESVRAEQFDGLSSDLENLNDVTLPALKGELVQANEEIANLRDVTLPELQNDLDQAEQDIVGAQDDINSLEGLFPITETSISNDAISTPKLQANAVTADKIVANAITTGKLDALAVTSAKIAALAITADKIAANAVEAEKILAGAVTTEKMTANSINGDRIAANTLAADKIIANSIGADQIAALSIVAELIAANAITAEKILAGAIETDKIDAGAITAEKIAALAVSAEKIAANAVTAEKILAESVGTDKLAANAVSAEKIQANAIEAGKIAAGAVTAEKIQADAINGKTIRGSRYIVEEVGSDFFEVRGSPAFGSSSNLYIWYGRKTSATWNSSTNDPILSGLSTVNSVNHTTTNGGVYFGGTFQAGTISISLRNTQLINNTIIDTGSYGSQGAQIQIAASFTHNAFDILSGTCPTVQQPTGTLFIEQGNTAGTSWTVVAQVPITGQTNTSQEPGECVIDSNAGATATFTDNQMSTSNRRYRARISVSGLYRGGDAENQSVSIISTED